MSRPRKQKNPRSRSAKLSHYKLMKVLECYANDLSVKRAAVITRVSERSLRDIYNGLRSRLVNAALHDPGRFNGFTLLLCNEEGEIEPEVLAAMMLHSKTKTFKDRMKRIYPRTIPGKHPVLCHVIEYFVRGFIAVDIPPITEDFKSDIQTAYNKANYAAVLLPDSEANPEKAALYHQGLLGHFLKNGVKQPVRRYGSKANQKLFIEMKAILLEFPL